MLHPKSPFREVSPIYKRELPVLKAFNILSTGELMKRAAEGYTDSGPIAST